MLMCYIVHMLWVTPIPTTHHEGHTMKGGVYIMADLNLGIELSLIQTACRHAREDMEIETVDFNADEEYIVYFDADGNELYRVDYND